MFEKPYFKIGKEISPAKKWTRLKKHPGIYSYETDNGKRYALRTRYKTMDGYRREWSRSGFQSWRDADIELKKFQVKLSDGTIANAEQKRITLNNYFNQLRERKKRLGLWRPSTIYTLSAVYNKHLAPRFGNEKINDITRPMYQRLVDSWGAQNFATQTIKSINQIMQMIMNDAEHNNIIQKNMLRSIDIVGGKDPKSQNLDKKQFDTFMQYCQDNLTKYQFAMIYLLSLGERRGELMGLRKSSFKFQRDEVNQKDLCQITFNLNRTRANPEGGPLKTKSSYRSIGVSGTVVELLHYVVTFSDRIWLKYGGKADKDHFIWLTPSSGRPYALDHPNKIMEKMSDECGIRVHPHLLRHYFATKARSDRLPDMDVMHWLGHRNLQMTDSYTRATPEGALNVFKGISKDL